MLERFFGKGILDNQETPKSEPDFSKLKSLAETNFVIKEKRDYNIAYEALREALLAAGMEKEDVQELISKSFGSLNIDDLANSSEKISSDINRIISNVFKQVSLDSKTVKKEEVIITENVTELPESIVAETETTPAVLQSEPIAIAPRRVWDAQLNSVSRFQQMEDQNEDNNIDASEEEYNERKKLVVKPAPFILSDEMKVVKPEPLVLTSEMKVEKSDSETKNETLAEGMPKPKGIYLQKIDAVSNLSPEERNSAELMTELFTGLQELRASYNLVNSEAGKKLRRFSGTYTPSPEEKTALIYKASLSGRFKTFSNAIEPLGMDILEVMENTEITQADKNPWLEGALRRYAELLDGFSNGVETFANLLEAAENSEKAPLVDDYRAQFKQIEIAGNSLLNELADSNPAKTYLQSLLLGDLVQLQAHIGGENGGKYLVQNFSSIVHRRDRIKNTIAYIQSEREHNVRVAKTGVRVAKLQERLRLIPAGDLESEAGVMRLVLEDQIKEINSHLQPKKLIDWSNELSLKLSSDYTFEAAEKTLSEETEKIKVLINKAEYDLGNFLQRNKVAESVTLDANLNSIPATREVSAKQQVDVTLPKRLPNPFLNTSPKNVPEIEIKSKESPLKKLSNWFIGRKSQFTHTPDGALQNARVSKMMEKIKVNSRTGANVLKVATMAGLFLGVFESSSESGEKVNTFVKSSAINYNSTNFGTMESGIFDANSIINYLRSIEPVKIANAEVKPGVAAENLPNISIFGNVDVTSSIPELTPETKVAVHQMGESLSQTPIVNSNPVISTEFTTGAGPKVSFASPRENTEPKTEVVQDIKLSSLESEPTKNTVNKLPNDLSFDPNPVAPETPLPVYEINAGDNFWNIMEGQTKAGTLPVMKLISSWDREKLIDVLRDELNNDNDLRSSLGSFGDDIDTMFSLNSKGNKQTLNMDILNQAAMRIAEAKGYLQ